MLNAINKFMKFKNQQKGSRVAPLIALGSAGRPLWTPRQYDRLAKEGYQRNVIVYRCVNLISRSAASVPWKLQKNGQTLEQHPLLDLLHRPNPLQGGAAFVEAVLGFKLLAGNSYIEMVSDNQGNPVELYPLRPDRVKVVPGENGLPKAYQYAVNGHSREIAVDPIEGTSAILHLKQFHPLDDWYGLSPIEAAASSIDQHNEMGTHNLSILQNGGRPSGALKLKPENMGNLGEEQRQQLRDDLRTLYQGSDNAGRVLLLEGDFDWCEMGLSPKDLDFAEGKNLSAREIAQAFGVPPILVGVKGDATFANYKEARLHLWEETVLPLLDHLNDELNRWLVQNFGEGLQLTTDIEDIPALVERRENTWKKVCEAPFLTINEKREALGYQRIEGGDQFQKEVTK